MSVDHEHWQQGQPPPRPTPGQLSLVDDQVVVESTPKARLTDPTTSHNAASAVRLKATSAKALLLLAHYDLPYRPAGLTDEEAAELAGISLASEYATRCSELRGLGLLDATEEEREGRAGVGREVSVITPVGIEYVRDHGWRTT